MPRVKLPSGSEVYIGVKHNKSTELPRVTKAWIRRPSLKEPLIEVEAKCSLKDNFCKLTGRKIAATRLLEALRHNFPVMALLHVRGDKADRKAIFQTICPEYPQKERKQR